MFLLVPAHPGFPGQIPQSRKTVVLCCVCVFSEILLSVCRFYTFCFIIHFFHPVIFILSKHIHSHTQPFYGSLDFVRNNPGEPVPEKTFTHSHLSWSSDIPYLLPSSITIQGVLPVQNISIHTTYLLCCLLYRKRRGWLSLAAKWYWA